MMIMTNRLTLDNKDFQFNESLLPCLVTGARKSGASYFSVSLIGQLITQGIKVIFFTAFPMAKEELIHQVWKDKIFEITSKEQIREIPENKSIIIQSGNKSLWENVIKQVHNIAEYVIFVKNIEYYDKSIMEVISTNTKILLSGTLEDCNFKESLIKKEWISKIIFTNPKIDLHVKLPQLEKYESYLWDNA